MSFYTTDRLRRSARTTSASARAELSVAARRSARAAHYDIFLSHSFDDAELILGLFRELEAAGNTVYVDWIDDADVDRENVTVETAQLLRRRLNMSSSLIYAATSNSTHSRWMPWELGYFDGLRQDKASVLPIVEPGVDVFRGNEFLFLYPFVELFEGLRQPAVYWRGDEQYTTLANFASRGSNVYRHI